MLKFTERYRPCAPERVKEIRQATGLTEPVAALLCARGLNTPEEIQLFLHPGPEQLLDPFLLPDMAAAVSRIKSALANHEKITVFCDYDADGTCGGSALYLYLTGAGASADIMTPNRHREGYGLSSGAIEQIAAAGSKLIVTVDCGITNIAETALARSLGMDVVITDHHECGEQLPDTPYIVNPKRPDSAYPYKHLAGCGVAFKLIHAMSSLTEALRYIDLVAIGTITDIVPMLGENRVIAHMGLKKMRKNPAAGIAALAQASGISLSDISSYGIGFGLGPRINAAGRMDTAEAALDILLAQKTSPVLKQNAARLCALNDMRRKDVSSILIAAEEMITANGYHTDPAILLADPGWNAGVIGIAAAKIADKYVRPCVLFGGEESLTGSARSIEGINIFEILSVFRDRYEKFGGHAQAAGLTIKTEDLDDLRRDVCRYIRENCDESVFIPSKEYDMQISMQDLTRRLVEDIRRLEPFGPGNEQPVIAVKDAFITSSRFVGKEKSHLKFAIKQNDAVHEAVSFGYRDSHALLPGRADFLCEAGIDNFNGRPQLIVRDIEPRFDDTLLDSFFHANAEKLLHGFMDEVSLDFLDTPDGMTEDSFEKTLSAALAHSRFGLCLSADTEPALRRLVMIPAVKTALLGGTLALWDHKSFTAGNCIAVGSVPGHPHVVRTGMIPSAFFDSALKSDYKEYALRFFSRRDELLALYGRMLGLLAKNPRYPRDIADHLALRGEKAAFALRVFCELKLIEFDNSGRISAIKNGGPRKELRQSTCYKNFEDLIDG